MVPPPVTEISIFILGSGIFFRTAVTRGGGELMAASRVLVHSSFNVASRRSENPDVLNVGSCRFTGIVGIAHYGKGGKGWRVFAKGG